MATTIRPASFETALNKFLTAKGVDKTLTKAYAKQLVEFQAAGLKIVDILDRGIPAPEWLQVKAVIPLESLSVLEKVLAVPKVRGIEIFPEGIINPELLVNIKLGNVR